MDVQASGMSLKFERLILVLCRIGYLGHFVTGVDLGVVLRGRRNFYSIIIRVLLARESAFVSYDPDFRYFETFRTLKL